jgi:hypothetical protein
MLISWDLSGHFARRWMVGPKEMREWRGILGAQQAFAKTFLMMVQPHSPPTSRTSAGKTLERASKGMQEIRARRR